jgi:hypothetical protein
LDGMFWVGKVWFESRNVPAGPVHKLSASKLSICELKNSAFEPWGGKK